MGVCLHSWAPVFISRHSCSVVFVCRWSCLWVVAFFHGQLCHSHTLIDILILHRLIKNLSNPIQDLTVIWQKWKGHVFELHFVVCNLKFVVATH